MPLECGFSHPGLHQLSQRGQGLDSEYEAPAIDPAIEQPPATPPPNSWLTQVPVP